MFTKVELSSLVRRTLPGPLREFTSGYKIITITARYQYFLIEFNNDNIIKDPTSETEYAMTDGKSLFLNIKIKVQRFRGSISRRLSDSLEIQNMKREQATATQKQDSKLNYLQALPVRLLNTFDQSSSKLSPRTRFLRKQISCVKSACCYFTTIHLPVILNVRRKSIPDHTFAKDEYMPRKH